MSRLFVAVPEDPSSNLALLLHEMPDGAGLSFFLVHFIATGQSIRRALVETVISARATLHSEENIGDGIYVSRKHAILDNHRRPSSLQPR